MHSGNFDADHLIPVATFEYKLYVYIQFKVCVWYLTSTPVNTNHINSGAVLLFSHLEMKVNAAG